MKDVIDELKKISDYLYQENVETGYAMLANVIPRMSQSIGDVEDENVRNLLLDKLKLALEAMENGDALLLADVLQYEVVEVLENL